MIILFDKRSAVARKANLAVEEIKEIMNRIWFVSHYVMPPQYEMREKTYKYAKILSEQGFDTTIVSASTIHNTDINLITGKEPYITAEYDGVKFIHIKCSPYRGNGLKRVKNMLEFSSKFYLYAGKFPLPDVIVADMNILDYAPIYHFCKKHNIRFYPDVRDLWPESIVEYLNYSPKNPIIRYLYHREKIMYKRADGVIFSMEGATDYIKEKGWQKDFDMSKFHYINNGVDLADFEYNRQHFILDDADLERNDKIKIVYAGSIRKANNIGELLDVAKKVSELGCNNIVFLIYGFGDEKDELMRRVKDEYIDNVIFKDGVKKKYVPSILSKADWNLIHVKQTKLMRFGSSLNKLFEYFASGKPVLSDLDVNYDLIEKYDAGITLHSHKTEDIARAIVELSAIPKERYDEMAKNALMAAKDYDYNILAAQLLKAVSEK